MNSCRNTHETHFSLQLFMKRCLLICLTVLCGSGIHFSTLYCLFCTTCTSPLTSKLLPSLNSSAPSMAVVKTAFVWRMFVISVYLLLFLFAFHVRLCGAAPMSLTPQAAQDVTSYLATTVQKLECQG